MAARRVYVCKGGHCRRERSGRLARRLAAPDVEAVEVRCQKICDGPVIGCEIDGRLEWFGRVRGAKAVTALDRLFVGGEIPKPLRKRRDEKRAGRLRT